MKKYLKTFGKLFVLALTLLIADVIMGYTLEVFDSIFQKGVDSYYLEMGILQMFAVRLGFYIVIGGWAYLLAVIIYHGCFSTKLFNSKFKYIVGLTLLFYISITYALYGISLVLLSYFVGVWAIYYVLVKRETLGIYIKETALWYVIYLLFFFFYWLSSSLNPKILILQLIIYIPLAFIGQKIYSRLFDSEMVNPAKS